MSQCLPQHLLQLFQPREPIPYLPPVSKLPYERGEHYEKNVQPTRAKYGGTGRWLHLFEQAKDTPTAPVRNETREERRERKQKEREEALQYKLERDLALWDPKSDTNSSMTSDPFCTLFVSRINHETTESKLRREFEKYGPIKTIRMVHDINSGKSRGYAFIEFEENKSMHQAYKVADGTKIDGHRVKVDIERGRAVGGFKPQRLGGGLGGRKPRAKGENPHKKGQSSSSSATNVNGEVGRDRGESRDTNRDSSFSSNNRERERDRDPRGGRSYADRRDNNDRNGGGYDRRDHGRRGGFEDDRKPSRDSGRSSGRPVEFAPPPRGAFGASNNVPDMGSGEDTKFDPRSQRSKRSRSREGTIGGRYSSRDEKQTRSGGYGDGSDNGGGGGYRDRDRRRAW